MILDIKNVVKLYKNGRGVEDISFTLNNGEVLGLLGPNGSGKTTTMKAIAGLVRIDSGEIEVCGVDAVANHEDAMQHTGCLIEAPALYEHMSILRNMQLAARFYPDISDTDINEALQTVGMNRYTNDKIHSLSLGMRQRVGLALALISKPALLILDEPANGLDIEGMVLVRHVVQRAAAEGSAVLISSHLANEIQQCASKVAVIHSGRMLGMRDMGEIMQSFASVEDYFMNEVAQNDGILGGIQQRVRQNP